MESGLHHDSGSTEAHVPVAVIAGPTAGGKSRLALDLAELVPGVEVVSADSRQVYRQISIGTAKPTDEERRRLPHHCIDLVDVSERYSAGLFSQAAGQAIQEIRRRGGIPLVVGGTGFYLRALFEGLLAPPLRRSTLELLNARLQSEGLDPLVRELRSVDPDSAERIDPANRERIVRALGCYLDYGRPYSSYMSDGLEGRRQLKPSYLILSPQRDLLNERIRMRVETMVDAGLPDEVNDLLARGFSEDAPGLRTVGYRETLRFLSGSIDREGLITEITVATRRYAKRQRTWFRNQVDADIRIDSAEGSIEELAEWLQAFAVSDHADRMCE